MKKFTLLFACAIFFTCIANAQPQQVFKETCGPQVTKKPDGFWPNVGEYTGFDNKAPITIEGVGASAFESVRWVQSLPDPAMGSHIYFGSGKSSVLKISNIPTNGYTDLKLSFTLACHEAAGGKTSDAGVLTASANGKALVIPEVTIPGGNKGVVQVENIPLDAAASMILEFSSSNALGLRIDNFTITGIAGASIEKESATELNLFVNGQVVSFTTEEAQNVSIYSLTGALLINKMSNVGVNNLRINNSGMYILKVGNKTVKVRI